MALKALDGFMLGAVGPKSVADVGHERYKIYIIRMRILTTPEMTAFSSTTVSAEAVRAVRAVRAAKDSEGRQRTASWRR